MKPKYKPTAFSKRKDEAILSAYEKMEFIEQSKLNRIADNLVITVKDHSQQIQMSRAMAIEVIGKLGMLNVGKNNCKIKER